MSCYYGRSDIKKMQEPIILPSHLYLGPAPLKRKNKNISEKQKRRLDRKAQKRLENAVRYDYQKYLGNKLKRIV